MADDFPEFFVEQARRVPVHADPSAAVRAGVPATENSHSFFDLSAEMRECLIFIGFIVAFSMQRTYLIPHENSCRRGWRT